MTPTPRIFPADLDDPADREAWLTLLNAYAQSEAGGGKPLAEAVRLALPDRLLCWPGFYTWLAWQGRRAVGLINCFAGFSTFAASATLNIHDLYVDPEFRGRGIAQRLLQRAEEEALHIQCCKITLEVLEGNSSALELYAKCGFAPYKLLPDFGRALFLEKALAARSK